MTLIHFENMSERLAKEPASGHGYHLQLNSKENALRYFGHCRFHYGPQIGVVEGWTEVARCGGKLKASSGGTISPFYKLQEKPKGVSESEFLAGKYPSYFRPYATGPRRKQDAKLHPACPRNAIDVLVTPGR